MKLKYLFNLFLITSPLVLSSGCDGIDKTLSNSVGKCTTNEKGEITGLEIINNYLNEEQVNKLLSYDLTNLSYTIGMLDGTDEIPDREGFTGVPTAISNLKNLESLKIFFDSYIHPCSSDCEFAGITNIGKDILKNLKNLKSLYIGGINVSQDNIDEISTLENLEELTFYFSYLDDTIDYKPLGNLKKLYKLNVQNTALGYLTLENEYIYKKIPEGLVKANKGIKELTMRINAVTINKDDLPNLEKLKISNGDVDLSYLEQFDKITDLEISYRGNYAGFGDEYIFSNMKVDLSKMKSLKSLSISSMFITEELMDSIVNIPNLEKLSLSGNRILDDGFNEKFKKLKTLSSLSLTGGDYSSDLEDAIKSFTNLRNLTIKNSYQLKGKIPEYIYSLKELEYLDLTSNSISNIDNEISNLTNLKYLNLYNNEIINVNEEIGKLVNLEYLDLSSNKLLTIPIQIMNLKKLEYLDLSNNKISDESPEYLNDLENLKYFYINKNTDLYGKVLINKNLIECKYDNYNLCIPKGVEEVKCLSPSIRYETCTEDNIEISTNGLCGKDNGRCPYGQCCGKNGKCGTTKDYCSINQDCQMKYGRCKDECQEINEYLYNNKMEDITCKINNERRAIEVELSTYIIEDDQDSQNLINQLANLKSLEKLGLDNFNYDEVDLSPLKELIKLSDLIIYSGSNKSKTIPEPILSLTSLKRLELYYIGITSIPDTISNLKNLEYLNFGSGISEISPKIGELKNLKEIDLRDCEIKKVPVEFGNLKNLEKLDLSYCSSITNFSEFIGNLENLKYLDMNSCYWKSPKEIGNLSKLEELNLQDNNIETLPKEFENLKSLKNLNLRYNSLTEFPEFIGNFNNLEILDMSSNSINDEIPKLYNNLYNLTDIDFTFNEDIKGETLTNKNLVRCRYDAFTDEEKVYSLCRHESDSCLERLALKYYKLCDNPVTLESSTTTTTTTVSTPTDKLEFITTTTTTTVVNTTTAKSESTTTTTTTTVVNTITAKSESSTTTINTTTDKSESSTTTKTTEKTTTTLSKEIEPTVVEGRCGKGFGNCKPGNCCSKHGWCGASNDYCAISKGCQSEFGECKNEINESTTTLEFATTTTSTEKTTTTSEDPKPIDVKYRCGKKYYNANCPSGECCSNHGWCGTSDDHCAVSKGCQSEFGECNSTTDKSETPEKPETTTTVEGRCGEGYGKCPEGQCCSKYGWCGKAYIYCSLNEGCKPEYGICTQETSIEGRCGEGYGKCPSGQCCSKYGWCGTSSVYCDSGCQSEFGKCN
jgi:Leucine-rich repeat (LRR) protein